MARSPTPGANANVVSMDKAQRKLERIRKARRDDPPPMTPRGPNDVLAGKWNADMYGMPSDPGCECPVEPIGFEGGSFYLIDSRGQFRSMSASDMNQVGIQDLFSQAPNYPKWMKPRWHVPKGTDPDTGKPFPPKIKSFEADEIKEVLFYACSMRGFFSPADRMRGRGAWTWRTGNIVYHAGDALWEIQNGKFVDRATGVHENKLYPRLAPIPEPWTQPISPEENPAGKLLQIFRKWNWTRPEVDPVLLLGWIGCAILGGALDWRSSVLILGDWGTGKSTLQDNILAVFGDALMRTADTTAAGLYQAMAHDCRPIALDELEPDSDPRKLNAVTHLMRTSASGDIGQRGGPTKGEASKFQMKSAFLFSAINNPLHAAQDLSRCAVLRLGPINRNQPMPPAIDAETTGPMMIALMMQGWGQGGIGFNQARARFMRALEEGGHAPRGQKQYGTLLACAWLLLGPELSAELDVKLGPDEDLHWAELLAANALPEVEDAKPNYRQCVDKILTTPVLAWRNSQRNTIGQVLQELRTTDDEGNARPEEAQLDRGTAKRDVMIAGFGLFSVPEIVAGVMRSERITLAAACERYNLPAAGWVLAVPNASPKVAAHLAGTEYAQGGWKDALRQCPVPGVMISHAEINHRTIDGTKQRCTLIVLDRYHDAPEK
ncbi:hypothetical protein [Bradyrhizobium sp. STM 3557]|uniref:hypothetical protein n=1 Tax=Bradyrhizobium sp. STM 3557 TaxID=578920 RepID=UPI0038908FB6